MVRYQDLKIARNPRAVAARHTVMSGPEVPGTLHTAIVSGPGDLALDLRVFLADQEENGVVWCHERISGPPQSRDLENRLRMGILAAGTDHFMMELGTLLVGEPGRRLSVKFQGLSDLSDAIGESAEPLLLASGVERIGTRENLIGDASRRRGYLAALLPAADPVMPALTCFCVTRVMPLLRVVEASY